MAFLNEFVALYNKYSIHFDLAVAAAASLMLFFFFSRRRELSAHALENTVTTLVIYALNYLLIIGFLQDVDQTMQSGYKALGIPTIDRAFWNGAPFVVTCLFAIVAKDFADYWNHRFMHTRWGWPTHAAHHSDTHVNGFTSFRIHFFELLVMSTSHVVLLTWLQIPSTIPVVLLFWSMHNIYVHLDLDYDHGRLKYLVASPRFHRWHHADVPEAYGKNLANVMPIYDALFGTYYNPGPCREKMGALSAGVADKDPVSVVAYPFLEWSRMVRDTLRRKKAGDEMQPQASAK